MSSDARPLDEATASTAPVAAGRRGPRWLLPLASWLLALAMWGVAALTVASTLNARYERDVARIVLNRNVDLLYAYLHEAQDQLLELSDQLSAEARISAETAVAPDTPYLVISLADRSITLRQGDQILFEGSVAIGKGQVKLAGRTRRFNTPRGRREVIAKEEDPKWVPPYWHYQELADRRGVGIKVLNRGETVSLSGGDTLEVRGADVVRVDSKTGAVKVYPQGKDIVVDGAAIVPPFGTRPRQFPGELGTRRLHLGDGYAIHGTDKAASIGTAASHGCIRMLNEEIEILYDLVPVHTPVFIY